MISSGSIGKDEFFIAGGLRKSSISQLFQDVKTSGSSSGHGLLNRQKYINTFYRREMTCLLL